MAIGRRETEEQQELFVMHERLPRSPGHVFYDKLNGLLREAGFDRYVEALCEPYYAAGKGRPSGWTRWASAGWRWLGTG